MEGSWRFFVVVVVVSRYCIVTIQKKVFISYELLQQQLGFGISLESVTTVFLKFINECLFLSITSTDFIINKRAIYAMFRTKSPNK